LVSRFFLSLFFEPSQISKTPCRHVFEGDLGMQHLHAVLALVAMAVSASERACNNFSKLPGVSYDRERTIPHTPAMHRRAFHHLAINSSTPQCSWMPVYDSSRREFTRHRTSQLKRMSCDFAIPRAFSSMPAHSKGGCGKFGFGWMEPQMRL
jgi:hypothetical protein